jgi:hypothetical protein
MVYIQVIKIDFISIYFVSIIYSRLIFNFINFILDFVNFKLNLNLSYIIMKTIKLFVQDLINIK